MRGNDNNNEATHEKTDTLNYHQKIRPPCFHHLLLLNKLVSDVKNPPPLLAAGAGDSAASASATAGALGSAVGVDGARLLRCRGK